MFWSLKYFLSCLFLFKCSIETRAKGDLGQNVVNVSRVNGGDLFTVSSDMICRSINCSCVSGNEFKGSHFVNKSDGVCTFQCNADKPTYLVHERKCVNFSRLLNNLRTSTKERNDCRQWLPVSYHKNRKTFTREIPSVIDFKTSGSIDFRYNGSNRLLWEHANCSRNNLKIFYILNNQGKWKSVPLENFAIQVAFVKVSATLQWGGPPKNKFLGKTIKVKLRCVNKTNEDQEKCFCIMLKTKGTTSVPFLSPGPTKTSYRSAGRTYKCTTHKSCTNGNEEQTIASPENKNSYVTGIVAAAVVVVLVLLFVAAGLFVKRRYLRKRAINNGPSNSNPMYEHGPDASSTFTDPTTSKNEKGFKEDPNNYQPLIQNTKIKDSSGRIPVYQHLIRNKINTDRSQNNHGMYAVSDVSPRCKQNVDSGNQKTITGETGKESCSPNTVSEISKLVPVNHLHNIGEKKKGKFEPGHNPGQVQEDSTSSSSNANIQNNLKVCEQDPYYHVLDISTNTDNNEKESKQEASAQGQYYHVLDISNPINKIM